MRKKKVKKPVDKRVKKAEMDKVKKAIEKQTGGKVKMVKFNPKRMVIWLVVLFFVMPFFLSMFMEPMPVDKVGMSQLLNDIKAEKVERIEVEEERLLIKYKGQEEGMVESRKEAGESFVEILDRAGIDPTMVDFDYEGEARC